MPRTRPSTDPISFHKPTGQFYVTRGGSRVYLGADRDSAIERYHRMALGLAEVPKQVSTGPLSAKELANRFIVTQQANWRSPETTLKGYSDWLKRFLEDHPRLQSLGKNPPWGLFRPRFQYWERDRWGKNSQALKPAACI
jgi:hypothetical protein